MPILSTQWRWNISVCMSLFLDDRCLNLASVGQWSHMCRCHCNQCASRPCAELQLLCGWLCLCTPNECLYASIWSFTYVLFTRVLWRTAAALWMIVSTHWKLPISATHSIVGATVGMLLAYGGPQCVIWWAIPPYHIILLDYIIRSHYRGNSCHAIGIWRAPVFDWWVTTPYQVGYSTIPYKFIIIGATVGMLLAYGGPQSVIWWVISR